MRILPGLLLLVVGVAGCAAPESPSGSERIALEFVELLRSGDPDVAVELFAGTAVWTDVAAGVEARGLLEIQERVARLSEGTASLFVDIVELHPAEGHVTIEWIRDGVTDGADGGEPARFTVEGATVLVLEDGRIVRAVDYADPTSILVARGGRVIDPDGVERLPVRPDVSDPSRTP